MNKIFPGCVNVTRLKNPARNDYEMVHNLKLFQTALLKCKVNNDVPIQALVKGKYQDNFEFVQWFKKFADLNYLANNCERTTDDAALSTDFLTTKFKSKKFDVKTKVIIFFNL